MAQNFRLEDVKYIPKELDSGVIYVAMEFGASAHLCACGCGSKVRTPLGPTEWSVSGSKSAPTLRPSIGNWQKPCRSHYLITRGNVEWANQWSDEQVKRGRKNEEKVREEYFAKINKQQTSILGRLWNWIKALFQK